ncbi:MAG TPA: cupin domain-containing protein [Anaeromyxobacteraceae bacterium]|nr:cupin domain-containing protein [Anaeromyxobacteraceae bacterium]
MSDVPTTGHDTPEAEDRSRHLGEPVREIDLAREARELREDETWQREGHNAKTLVKNDSLRIVLIDMHQGARLGEHQTDSRISIQVLTGKVSVRLPGKSHAVAAGQLLAVDESLPHDVEALEPSTFLLTIARGTRQPGGRREPH